MPKIQFDKKKFEAVVPITQLRHIAADVKRLNDLTDNRLVQEHAELSKSVPAAIADLYEKLEAYEAEQAAKREVAKRAAAEGDAMVDGDKPPARKKKATKKKATKKAASKS